MFGQWLLPKKIYSSIPLNERESSQFEMVDSAYYACSWFKGPTKCGLFFGQKEEEEQRDDDHDEQSVQ